MCSPSKIQIRSVTIDWAEGPTWVVDRYPLTVPSIKAADRALWAVWSLGRSDQPDYRKVGFTITYCDGETYTGKLEINTHGPMPDILGHVRRFVDFYTGERCPAHMTNDEYERHLARFDSQAEQLRAFRAAYDLEDTQ